MQVKAQLAQNLLDIASGTVPQILPLYNQPSDVHVYKENQSKFMTFKPLLIQYLKRKQEQRLMREQNLIHSYRERMRRFLQMQEADMIMDTEKRQRDAQMRE